MKQSYLIDRSNSSSVRPRIEMDISNNGLEILNREGYLSNKPIAKTGVYRLPNGIGRLYYLDADNKIMAGAYTVTNNEFPVIGELIDEPLEMD